MLSIDEGRSPQSPHEVNVAKERSPQSSRCLSYAGGGDLHVARSPYVQQRQIWQDHVARSSCCKVYIGVNFGEGGAGTSKKKIDARAMVSTRAEAVTHLQS
jgi:hypothetical protein